MMRVAVMSMQWADCDDVIVLEALGPVAPAHDEPTSTSRLARGLLLVTEAKVRWPWTATEGGTATQLAALPAKGVDLLPAAQMLLVQESLAGEKAGREVRRFHRCS